VLSSNHLLTGAVTALVIYCGGCTRLPQGALVPVAQANTVGTSIVPVLVATTRNRATADPGDMFNGQRADQASYASIAVSIPPDTARKIGEVQWPTTMPADPQHSFVTASATYLDRPSFIAAVSSSVKKNGNGKVLVFVHGFNNRFDEAVYRFAQVVHDAKSPAVPVLFSWPSQGLVSLAAYKDDRMNATSSGEALDQLLNAVAGSKDVKEVNVLCHSMGCLLTLETLHARAIHAGKIGGKIKNVLLVAPDVSVDVFRSEMQEMGSAKPRFALFLSEDDQALKLSKSIGDGVTRLGNVNPDQEPYNTEFQREGILVFDLTGLRGGAHSRAFTDVTSVMGMIQQRLAEGQQLTD